MRTSMSTGNAMLMSSNNSEAAVLWLPLPPYVRGLMCVSIRVSLLRLSNRLTLRMSCLTSRLISGVLNPSVLVLLFSLQQLDPRWWWRSSECNNLMHRLWPFLRGAIYYIILSILTKWLSDSPFSLDGIRRRKPEDFWEGLTDKIL